MRVYMIYSYHIPMPKHTYYNRCSQFCFRYSNALLKLFETHIFSNYLWMKWLYSFSQTDFDWIILFFFLMIHISFSLFLIHESTLPRSFTKGHNVNLPAVWCNGYISVWSFAVKLCVVLVHFTWCFIPVREPLQFVPSA